MKKDISLLLVIILIGVAGRLLPHPPNFTPITALALFSGAVLKRKWLPLVIMAVSDLFLGLHSLIPYTWGSILLITLLGSRLNWKAMPLASFLFFVVTNFGVWLQGWYAMTLKGLVECYVMALPFYRNSILGDAFYTFAIFGAYKLAQELSRGYKTNPRW